MKIVVLVGCVGYAAYGFITGNLIAGGSFAVLALLVLLAIVRPPPRWQDGDQISVSQRLVMLGLVAGTWTVALYFTVGAISQPDVFLGLLAVLMYICALGLTWILVAAEIKLRRSNLLRRSLSGPPEG